MGTKETVVRKGTDIIVIADEGYLPHIVGQKLLRLRNNNNGWDVKVYSYHSTTPAHRFNLGYDELPLLLKAGTALNDSEGEPWEAQLVPFRTSLFTLFHASDRVVIEGIDTDDLEFKEVNGRTLMRCSDGTVTYYFKDQAVLVDPHGCCSATASLDGAAIKVAIQFLVDHPICQADL